MKKSFLVDSKEIKYNDYKKCQQSERKNINFDV